MRVHSEFHPFMKMESQRSRSIKKLLNFFVFGVKNLNLEL